MEDELLGVAKLEADVVEEMLEVRDTEIDALAVMETEGDAVVLLLRVPLPV